jgi:hypothetical protein
MASSLVRTFAEVLSAMSVWVRVAVDDDRPFDKACMSETSIAVGVRLAREKPKTWAQT